MISYISRNHKIQFSHIPKSGCQSIRKFIIKINNEDPNMNIWQDQFTSKYVINTARTVDGFDHYSIVRNPFSRIVSCYYNKIIGIHWPHFRFYFGHSLKEKPTFEEFVKHLKNGLLNQNEHWRTQTSLIGQANTKIFKIEEKDFLNSEMVEKTNHNFFHFRPIDHMESRKDLGIFVGKMSANELNEYYNNKTQPIVENFYNEEIVNIVKKLYKCDFDNFNYPSSIRYCNE
jgi:hypothetical protein